MIEDDEECDGDNSGLLFMWLGEGECKGSSILAIVRNRDFSSPEGSWLYDGMI